MAVTKTARRAIDHPRRSTAWPERLRSARAETIKRGAKSLPPSGAGKLDPWGTPP
jgi:hypothetical protein